MSRASRPSIGQPRRCRGIRLLVSRNPDAEIAAGRAAGVPRSRPQGTAIPRRISRAIATRAQASPAAASRMASTTGRPATQRARATYDRYAPCRAPRSSGPKRTNYQPRRAVARIVGPAPGTTTRALEGRPACAGPGRKSSNGRATAEPDRRCSADGGRQATYRSRSRPEGETQRDHRVRNDPIGGVRGS